jgi:hypothetical protein
MIAALVFGLVSGLFANAAQAATESTRIAQITKLTGEVYVKKSGGTKEFKAYVNMTLNQGDFLRTGKNSSVVLKVLDREDELTFDANSSVFLSQLKTADDGKKTSVSMWSGSVYAKASKLVGGDKLEIETPTAVMGVRGTHFIAAVDPDLGDTSIFVMAGVVEGEPKSNNPAGPGTGGASDSAEDPGAGDSPNVPPDMRAAGSSRTVFVIYPSMQTSILNSGAAPSVLQSIVDTNELIRKTGPAVVTALIVNHGSAAREREEFLNSLRQGTVPPSDAPAEALGLDVPDGVELLTDNLSNLTGAIVNAALAMGRLTAQELQSAVEQARQSDPGGGIVINPNASLRLNERQQQLQQLMREREEQQQRAKQQRELERQEQAEKHADLLSEIERQQDEQRKQNEQAAAERNREAENRLLEQMTPEEREAFEQRRKETEQGTASPPAPPAPPAPAPPPSDEEDDSPAPPPPPAVRVPDETRSSVAVEPFFNLAAKLTGAEITVRLADANGSPIASVAEFRLEVSKNGAPKASLPYDPAKPAGSSEYRFRFAPTEPGAYTLTPVVKTGTNASPVSFAPITFVSIAPSIAIVQPADQANKPIPGTFELILNGVSEIRGLEVHLLTDGFLDEKSIVVDPDGLFGAGAIADWYITTGSYNNPSKLYDELVYAVIADEHGTPTGNPVRPYVLLRVSDVYHTGKYARVIAAKTTVILADGSKITLADENEIEAIAPQ